MRKKDNKEGGREERKEDKKGVKRNEGRIYKYTGEKEGREARKERRK